MDSVCKLPTVDEVAGLMGLPPATAGKLLGMVPSRMDTILASLRAGLDAEDWEAVARDAHAAKGVCSNLRLQPMVDIVHAIEQNAKQQRLASESQGLCNQLERFTEELRRMLSGGSQA